MTEHVYLMGVRPTHDSRGNQILAIFTSYEKAKAYVIQHTEPREDGDGRKIGVQYTGVMSGWKEYEIVEIPVDPAE